MGTQQSRFRAPPDLVKRAKFQALEMPEIGWRCGSQPGRGEGRNSQQLRPARCRLSPRRVLGCERFIGGAGASIRVRGIDRVRIPTSNQTARDDLTIDTHLGLVLATFSQMGIGYETGYARAVDQDNSITLVELAAMDLKTSATASLELM